MDISRKQDSDKMRLLSLTAVEKNKMKVDQYGETKLYKLLKVCCNSVSLV